MVENQNDLDSWIFSHVDELNLKVEALTWIDSILPGYHDAGVRLVYNGIDLSGWGISENSTIALHKAVTELIERSVLFEHHIKNSNGMSGHITQDRANIAAVNELIERDLFLSHFYSFTPLSKSENHLLDEAQLGHVRDWLSEHCLEMTLHRLGTTGIAVAIHGQNFRKPFGFVLGTSVKETLAESVRSCVPEVIRRTYGNAFVCETIAALSLENFYRLESVDFLDHGRLALNLSYARQHAWLFSGSHVLMDAVDSHKTNVVSLKPSSQIFVDCPLYFARATSADKQSLFVGVPTVENLNLARLSEFSGKALSFCDINPAPHPFA